MQFKSIRIRNGVDYDEVSCFMVRINIIAKWQCFTLLKHQTFKQVGMRSMLQGRLPSTLDRSPKYQLGYLNNSKNPSVMLSEKVPRDQ